MTEEAPSSPHGALYWFCFHTRQKLKAYAENHRRKLVWGSIIAAFLIFVFRAVIHGVLLDIRKLIFPILLVSILIAAFRQCRRRSGRLAKVGLLLDSLVLFSLPFWGPQAYTYVWYYLRYERLNLVVLSELPVTDHERIQPQNSVYSLAHDAVTENEAPMTPDFVRVGSEYRWTIGVEPAYPVQRALTGVAKIFNIPGTTPELDFSTEHRVPVHFETGEHLMFSRNAHTAVTRSLGVFRFFSYDPAEVMYFPDDNGEWVQVVTLVRWRGFFFPYPEFGGVQIIRQQKETFSAYLHLLFLGAGEWIPPEDVLGHKFLKGQNIVSEQVSLPIGESFRFQNGFLAPLPGYHNGDIRIPDLERDVNPQPFVSFFKHANEGQGSLYHYFALEPFDIEKQGLNTSVFVPADGSPQVYVYRHFEHDASLSGVSSMATKVMESHKQYDWEQNRPVEHRPFLKEVGGRVRFFWLTTVVTKRLGQEKGRFIAGSTPEVVLTDAQYNSTIWVNSNAPDTWMETIQTQLGARYAEEQPHR
ncbi:MAG: hypothetical protein U0136_10365 [Bdellovibrionota bacterium]